MQRHQKESEGGTRLEYREEDIPKDPKHDEKEKSKNQEADVEKVHPNNSEPFKSLAQEESLEDGLDADAAAMMGFSGFGTTKTN